MPFDGASFDTALAPLRCDEASLIWSRDRATRFPCCIFDGARLTDSAGSSVQAVQGTAWTLNVSRSDWPVAAKPTVGMRIRLHLLDGDENVTIQAVNGGFSDWTLTLTGDMRAG